VHFSGWQINVSNASLPRCGCDFRVAWRWSICGGTVCLPISAGVYHDFGGRAQRARDDRHGNASAAVHFAGLCGDIRFKGKATGAEIRVYSGAAIDVLARKVHNVQIGDLLIGSATAAVLDDTVAAVSKQVGTQLDAVAGWPLLSRYAMVLDYRRHRFRKTSDFRAANLT